MERLATAVVMTILIGIAGCGDKAKRSLDLCEQDEKAGDLASARKACEDAVSLDANSPSGKVAATKLGALKQAIEKADADAAAKKREEAAAARRKADEEARGVEVECAVLLKEFISNTAGANSRYVGKRVITSGVIDDAKWVAKGNITLCPVGSDAEGYVSGILCKLDPKTTEDVKAALKTGDTVKIAGRVEKFFRADIGVGVMSQLTIDTCEIVK